MIEDISQLKKLEKLLLRANRLDALESLVDLPSLKFVDLRKYSIIQVKMIYLDRTYKPTISPSIFSEKRALK